jgi:hypothetical protein
MFGSAIVGVAVGLFLLYLLLSMLTTTIQESIANLLRLRQGNLIKGVETLLHDPAYADLTAKVYEHPLILRLYPGVHERTLLGRVVWTSGPSYIKAETFVAALLDTVRRELDPQAASSPLGLNELLGEAKTIVDGMRPGPLKTNLMLAVGDVRADIQTVKKRLETWFDEAMDRVSGWYRQKAQIFALTLGFVTALVLNADSVHLAVRLWQDQPLREAISADARAVIDAVRVDVTATGEPGAAPLGSDDAARGSATRVRDALTRLERLPIGWLTWDDAAPPAACVTAALPPGGHRPCRPLPLLPFAFQPGQTPWTALLGWFLTAVALSLGSTFWFSILSRALQLRASGTRIPTSSEVEAGAVSARR